MHSKFDHCGLQQRDVLAMATPVRKHLQRMSETAAVVASHDRMRSFALSGLDYHLPEGTVSKHVTVRFYESVGHSVPQNGPIYFI